MSNEYAYGCEFCAYVDSLGKETFHVVTLVPRKLHVGVLWHCFVLPSPSLYTLQQNFTSHYYRIKIHNIWLHMNRLSNPVCIGLKGMGFGLMSIGWKLLHLNTLLLVITLLKMLNVLLLTFIEVISVESQVSRWRCE